MWKYIVKRILALIPVLLAIILLIFAIMEFTPGDEATMALGGMASEEAKQEWRDEQGLDKPFLVRYVNYVVDLVKGEMGTSYRTSKAISSEIGQRLPATGVLAVVSILFALLISVPVGLISAVRQNTIFDYTGMVFALLGIAIPSFWLGMLLILLFSLKLGWLPSGGSGTIAQLIMPAFTVGASCAANLARITRSSMLEVIRQDYIRTAKAKGVPRRRLS